MYKTVDDSVKKFPTPIMGLENRQKNQIRRNLLISGWSSQNLLYL